MRVVAIFACAKALTPRSIAVPEVSAGPAFTTPSSGSTPAAASVAYCFGLCAALAGSLLDAVTPTAQTRNNVALIGIKPEKPIPTWVISYPDAGFEDGTRSVQRVVNSSGKALARELVARGAFDAPALLRIAQARRDTIR